MIINLPSQHAIKALVYMANKGGEFVRVQDVAASEDIPSQFLSSLLRDLSYARVLESAKGPRGGFRLARNADRITLHDIVSVVGGVRALDDCPFCYSPRLKRKCLGHDEWAKMRDQILDFLNRVTIKQLMETK